MRHPIVFDLETKHSFREFPDPKDLKVSCAAVYDYKDKSLKIFMEEELSKLFSLMEEASLIIGFNIISFDFPVLQPYYAGNIYQFKAFDILEDIRKILGRRLALNDILNATLNKKKSGHGLDAITYFREGQLEKLKKYCLDDASLTREIFEYGAKEKKIYYLNAAGKQSINVDWDKYLKDEGPKNDISLTLPF